MTRLSYNGMHFPSFPDLPCPCGAVSSLIITAKTGNNFGRQFYRCPCNQGTSCGFFKWCNNNAAEASHSANANNTDNNFGDSANNCYGVRGTLACFKCGKEGHWVKDCTFSASGFSHHSSVVCYKCGKPGHWAKDCASSSNMTMPEAVRLSCMHGKKIWGQGASDNKQMFSSHHGSKYVRFCTL